MTDQVSGILDIIKKCCIEISVLIRNGDSENMARQVSKENKAGDQVKKLDLISNEILKEHLLKCQNVRLIGSEEEPELLCTGYPNAKYLVCFDPLDGSSNISVNITVGTIFAIYKINKSRKVKSGRDIVMAGYCLYGGSTQLIVADHTHVKIWTLVQTRAVYDFILMNPNLKIPEKGPIYSVNESNKHKFTDPRINKVIETFIKQKKTTRWVGSLVADAHRTLIKGGFFAYPGNTTNPNGKLRLLYEVYPFAFIFNSAGGFSTNGKVDCILDIPFPENPHQKVPTIFGGPQEIKVFNSF